jgi:hypothetical protein
MLRWFTAANEADKVEAIPAVLSILKPDFGSVDDQGCRAVPEQVSCRSQYARHN